MGGFLNTMKNMLTQPSAGSPQWTAKQNVNQRQQGLDMEKEQQLRKNQEADQVFAEHMQSMGARPVVNGVVKDDHPIPDYLAAMGGGGGEGADQGSFKIVRKAGEGGRTVTPHKTAEGDTVQWELPTAEEQIRRQMMLNAPGLQAQEEHEQRTATAKATGTAAGQTAGRADDLRTRGVRLGDVYDPDQLKKFGLNPDYKDLPENIDKNIPQAMRGTVQQNISDNKLKSVAEISAANRASREQLAGDKLTYEKQANERNLAVKDAVSQRTSAIQAGENPNLAPIKLRQFTESVGKLQSMHSELDDRQNKIFAAHDLLDPETTPNGTKFPDPFTGAPKVMSDDIRTGLQDTLGAQKKLQEIQGGVASRQMQQLGIDAPTAKPAAGGGGAPAGGAVRPAGGGGAGAGGSGAAPQSTGTKLSPALESQAQSIAGFDMEPYSGRAATRGAPMRIMQRARELYESAHPGEKFDATEFLLKKDAVKDFSSGGKSGQQALALNTLVRHTDDLLDLIPQLGNGSFNPSNGAFQKMKAMFGSETPTNFDQLKQYLAGETVKLIRGGGGAESDVEAAKENINKSRSPEQLQGAMETNFKVAGGKMEALNASAKRQHLGDNYNVLDPGAKDIMTKRGYDPKTLKKMTGGGDLPKGNGALIDKATAQKFYDAAGKDPKKAQQLAESNGWKVQ